MESKKSALKINMADNKFRAAMAKIEIVDKAAKETPEKPVAEVWDIAKNAKAPPNITAPTPIPSTQAPISFQDPATQVAKPEPTASNLQQPPANIAAPVVAPQAPVSSTLPQGPAKSAGSNQAPNGTSSLPVSKLPAPPSQPASSTQSNIPRGGAIVRGRGGSYQAPRGSMAARGRGGGTQRGGANMNPGAPSFSPVAGNKHPRDDTQNGLAQQGNNGKRIRGGGGGQ